MYSEAFYDCLVRGYALHGSSLPFSADAFVILQTQYHRIVTVLGIVPNSVCSVVFWRPDIKDCSRFVTFQGPFVQFRICTHFIFGGINLANF